MKAISRRRSLTPQVEGLEEIVTPGGGGNIAVVLTPVVQIGHNANVTNTQFNQQNGFANVGVNANGGNFAFAH